MVPAWGRALAMSSRGFACVPRPWELCTVRSEFRNVQWLWSNIRLSPLIPSEAGPSVRRSGAPRMDADRTDRSSLPVSKGDPLIPIGSPPAKLPDNSLVAAAAERGIK